MQPKLFLGLKQSRPRPKTPESIMDRAARKRKILNLNLLKDDGQKKKYKKSKSKAATNERKTGAKRTKSANDETLQTTENEFKDDTVLVEDLNEGEDVRVVRILTIFWALNCFATSSLEF